MSHLEGSNENSLLFYLFGCRLGYCKPDPETAREKYSSNPWGYQPIVVYNKLNMPVDIDAELFAYFMDNYGISIEKLDMSEDSSLIERLINNFSHNSYSVCKVDEYYLRNSDRFYRKQHNRHFLLIKNILTDHKALEVIDSEKNSPYLVGYQELDWAFYNSIFRKKELYSIDCSLYINAVDTSYINTHAKTAGYSSFYLEPLIQDIAEKRQQNDPLDIGYYYQGYRYNILSKIIPMATMRACAFSCWNDTGVAQKCRNLVNEWKSLCTFMQYRISQGNLSFDPIMGKLLKINNHEKELEALLS